jgi:hypothetical protein
MQLGNGNDLGFCLNGFSVVPVVTLFSDHQGLRTSPHAVELPLRWETAHASRACSATRGKKEHLCNRYHIANARAALASPRMFGGLSETFLDRWKATAGHYGGATARKGCAFPSAAYRS